MTILSSRRPLTSMRDFYLLEPWKHCTSNRGCRNSKPFLNYAFRVDFLSRLYVRRWRCRFSSEWEAPFRHLYQIFQTWCELKLFKDRITRSIFYIYYSIHRHEAWKNSNHEYAWNMETESAVAAERRKNCAWAQHDYSSISVLYCTVQIKYCT